MYVINCRTITPIVFKCLQISLSSFPSYPSSFFSHTNIATTSQNGNITSAYNNVDKQLDAIITVY